MLRIAGPADVLRLGPSPQERARIRSPQRRAAELEEDLDWYCLEEYYYDPESWTLGKTTTEWVNEGQNWFKGGWHYYHGDGQHYWFDSGYYYHGDGWSASTSYNKGAMDAMGATDEQWAHLFCHERAHQMGWDHWEGTEEENCAYWPWQVFQRWQQVLTCSGFAPKPG